MKQVDEIWTNAEQCECRLPAAFQRHLYRSCDEGERERPNESALGFPPASTLPDHSFGWHSNESWI